MGFIIALSLMLIAGTGLSSQPLQAVPPDYQPLSKGAPEMGGLPDISFPDTEGNADFNLPNTGLKDPGEIIWPYEDEFTYEMVPDGPFNTFDMKNNIKAVSSYDIDEFTSRLVEEYEVRGYGASMVTTTTIDFDERRCVRILDTKHSLDFSQPVPLTEDEKGLQVVYEPRNGKMFIAKADSEIDVPKDGFFSFVGSDAPGLLALAISALDLDGDEPVTVWTFNGGDWILGEPTVGVFRFMRVGITPFEDCTPKVKRWWENQRDYYDDWEPPEDVKTYILEIEASKYAFYVEGENYMAELESTVNLYPNVGPYAAIYMDDENRLVRVEQPTGLLATLAELKKIGSRKTWWGD